MNLLSFLELTLLAAIWGASFLFMRIAAPELGAVFLMTLRVIIAMLCLLPLVFIAKSQRQFKGHWPHLFVVGLFSTALPFCLFGYASLHLPAGVTSVLNTTTPMFGVVVAYYWFKEKINGINLLGLCLGFVGIYLLMFNKMSHSAESVMLPTLAAFIATFCYAFAANYTKRYLSNVTPIIQATGSLICAAIILIPFGLMHLPEQKVSHQTFTAVILLGSLCTGFAYLIFFRLLTSIGPNNTISVTYLIPIFGLLWGYVFLNEQMTLLMFIGVFIVLFGVSLSTNLYKRIRFSRSKNDPLAQPKNQ